MKFTLAKASYALHFYDRNFAAGNVHYKLINHV